MHAKNSMCQFVVEKCLLATFLLLFVYVRSNGAGFQGYVYEKNQTTNFGGKVAGVKITFVRENSTQVYKTTSDQNGYYKITIPQARYWVRATHKDYEDYSTNPGFFVANGSGFQTGNFFLRKPVVTTVILVRHAEKANETDTSSLTADGFKRAKKLIGILWRSGITKTYTTAFKRACQTRKPFADSLKLDTAIYSGAQDLKDSIVSKNLGDVVFVVGHSPTVPQIISTFGGGTISDIGNEFDNMFILSIYSNGQTNVCNLQYGKSTTPNVIRGKHPVKTLLLSYLAGAGTAGDSLKQKLLHAVRTAGVRKLYAPNNSIPELQILKDTLSLQTTVYNAANVQQLLTQINNDTTTVSLIEADKATAEEIIKKCNAYPYPVIYSGERGNLIVITLNSTSAKLTHLRY